MTQSSSIIFPTVCWGWDQENIFLPDLGEQLNLSGLGHDCEFPESIKYLPLHPKPASQVSSLPCGLPLIPDALASGPPPRKPSQPPVGVLKNCAPPQNPLHLSPEPLPELPGVCSALTGKREFPKASGIFVGHMLGDLTKEGVDGA